MAKSSAMVATQMILECLILLESDFREAFEPDVLRYATISTHSIPLASQNPHHFFQLLPLLHRYSLGFIHLVGLIHITRHDCP